MSFVPRVAYSTLPRPTLTSQAIINPSCPLTPKTLRRVQDALNEAASGWSAPRDVNRAKAAVLCPLINVPVDGVDGQRTTRPAILFQVRANLRTHAGEVSFPGGKSDEDDTNLETTVRRETLEEFGIEGDRIRLLGAFGPPELSLKGIRVYPFAGYLSPPPIATLSSAVAELNEEVPLPIFDTTTLKLNTAEVAQVFYLTFEELADERRLRHHQFRGRPAYWTINVSDKVDPVYWTSPLYLPGEQPLEQTGETTVAGERQTKLEIWGLTGWYLNLFMRVVKLW